MLASYCSALLYSVRQSDRPLLTLLHSRPRPGSKVAVTGYIYFSFGIKLSTSGIDVPSARLRVVQYLPSWFQARSQRRSLAGEACEDEVWAGHLLQQRFRKGKRLRQADSRGVGDPYTLFAP